MHAKLITSAKIKTLGNPQNLEITWNANYKPSFIQSVNNEATFNEYNGNLDIYNNTNIQNSFLEIKNVLNEEFLNRPKTSSSIIKVNKIKNEKIPQVISKSNLMKNNKETQLSLKNQSFSNAASEDELVFKLNELEAKFRENYQVEEEKTSGIESSLIKEKKDSKLKDENRPINDDKYENEDNEEMNNFSEELNIEEFLNVKSEKKRYLEEHNVFMFYNSLSLIMLSMLGGGVIGIIFILYFSYIDENHKL